MTSRENSSYIYFTRFCFFVHRLHQDFPRIFALLCSALIKPKYLLRITCNFRWAKRSCGTEITFSTGVKYSATPSAVPFTEFITLCIVDDPFVAISEKERETGRQTDRQPVSDARTCEREKEKQQCRSARSHLGPRWKASPPGVETPVRRSLFPGSPDRFAFERSDTQPRRRQVIAINHRGTREISRWARGRTMFRRQPSPRRTKLPIWGIRRATSERRKSRRGSRKIFYSEDPWGWHGSFTRASSVTSSV